MNDLEENNIFKDKKINKTLFTVGSSITAFDGKNIKLSEVDTNSLDNELIKSIFFNLKKENYNYADYIVIYGCHIKELLDERLNYALEILNNHKFGKIILTGGIGANGNFNESEYMMDYLTHNSIDENKIII